MFHLNVLIVDDEPNIRKTLTVFMESRGHQVKAVSCSRDALAEAELHVFDLAFVDVRLGSENGLDLVPSLLAANPWIKIVVITAYASIDTAVEAMKRGAADYIPKPFTPDQLQLVTERLSAVCRMEQRIVSLQEDLDRNNPEQNLTSRYPSMQRAIALARQASDSDAVILLRGASGTGKNLFARSMHNWSRRSDKPFTLISCPSLRDDLLERELFGFAKGSFPGALKDNPVKVSRNTDNNLFLANLVVLLLAGGESGKKQKD